MYNVFVDFHHAGLLQSFILLFEKRLGGNVYRPIGMEWATQGFWKVYDHPATQAQFLNINGATPDGSPRLNEVTQLSSAPAITAGNRVWVYKCQDVDSGETNKAITFEGFMNTKIDIVIASLPQHIEPYKKLCEIHPNKPKLIYQIGNAWPIEAGAVRNVMASAKIDNIPSGINFISYHQEFDTNIFHPDNWAKYEMDGMTELSMPGKNISSFVNCFNIQQHFEGDYRLFEEIERRMPQWFFRAFGGQCRNGAAHGNREVAFKMREARFIWHTKAGGDGYGHVLFNSAAVGRPLITKKSYYANKLGEKLMIDGETCINIDNLPAEEIVRKIEYYSDPARYFSMCKAVYYNFKKQVDFAAEEGAIRAFLQNLA